MILVRILFFYFVVLVTKHLAYICIDSRSLDRSLVPGDVLLRESRAFRRCVSEMGG